MIFSTPYSFFSVYSFSCSCSSSCSCFLLLKPQEIIFMEPLIPLCLLETSKEEHQYSGFHHKYKINRSLRVLSLLSFFGFLLLIFFF
ncbi:hypothetical protein CXB51_003345 [Gossypium anomalum]|uniref:Uncharacterized protein n=1 Tax=Gossypium anomalum TaxID=47600 RepID=A0A8J5ZFT0_9ROSI|nr:hypothetical protein CXB51_003345 [Gossypium anomalum]